MDKQRVEETVKKWNEFADRQEIPEKVKINPDILKVLLLAEGVLGNEENHGFKYCPCRLTTGNIEADAKLICPCNFKVQETWKEKGECWCSLFVKDDEAV